MTWAGINGSPMKIVAVAEYIKQQRKSMMWSPRFVVLHNTAEPTLANWGDVSATMRMKGLAAYYRDEMGWGAGPHFFVSPDNIFPFSPLNHPGVHSPSWNGVAIGVEMVGDYNVEDFNSGSGLKVQELTLSLLTELYRQFGCDSNTLKFHKFDPKTTHKGCPGRYVSYNGVLSELHNNLKSLRSNAS